MYYHKSDHADSRDLSVTAESSGLITELGLVGIAGCAGDSDGL